jgi:deoxyribodipyrimidine photo-lyase
MLMRSLFIFRRDLRIEDNTGLIEALNDSDEVILAFIYDPRQVDSPDASSNALQFMAESLADLHKQAGALGGRLNFFKGIAEDVVDVLLSTEKIDAVYLNRDYTEFSRKRDLAIKNVCARHDRVFRQFSDILLHEPEEILRKGEPYRVFTPYFRSSMAFRKRMPASPGKNSFHRGLISTGSGAIAFTGKSNIAIRGGRENALEVLGSLERFRNYDHERDIPSVPTTMLSAHLKFGTVSIREVYHAIQATLGDNHALLRQLMWRDFWTYVGFHFPKTWSCMQERFNNIKWENDEGKFKAWCDGKTGYPIVDAGMRQLNETGFMHNRLRMVVASFLTKDLHIDWRWGEKYFRAKLLDYDPLVNNGNWQWAAGVGLDAVPYFRIFNPWLQQRKFDQECEYIKRWVPELRGFSPRAIHSGDMDYYPLIVDHKRAAEKARDLYSSA